jgi:hypothetical protein
MRRNHNRCTFTREDANVWRASQLAETMLTSILNDDVGE